MSYSSARDIVKTRKPHRCYWCDEPIPLGSPARYVAGYWHVECYAAYNRMGNEEFNDVQDGWMQGDFQRGKTPHESWGER